VAELVDDAKNGPSNGEQPAPEGRTLPGGAADPALDAATHGWGTTVRYGFLLLVRRGSIGAGVYATYDLAHRLGIG
jgi:hypothetical protein